MDKGELLYRLAANGGKMRKNSTRYFEFESSCTEIHLHTLKNYSGLWGPIDPPLS